MGKLQQAHTSVACSSGSLLTGLLFVWPSYTLQLYTAMDTKILSAPMSEIESSLLGSMPSLGAMLGTAVVGWIISIFGRQRGGIIIALPLLISWLMIDLTSSSIVILTARFLSGITAGATLVLSPIYISEIVEESIRGFLASGFSELIKYSDYEEAPIACYCTGVLLSYILGWFLSYRYVIWANLVCCLIYMALMLTVTESPLFLIRQRREEEAKLAIAHYKGGSVTSKTVLEEFSRLKQLVTPAVELIAVDIEGKFEKGDETEKEKLNTEKEEIEEDKNMSSLKMLLVSSSSRRGFIVVCAALTIQVMMGMIAVQVYAKDIFAKAAPSLSSHLCSVLFALVLLLGSLSSAVLSDRFGRRMLIITSSIAVGLCLAAMGFLLQTSVLPAWVTAVIILVYCCAFMFGAGSVPYILLAEVFIPEVQSLASTLLLEWVFFLNFFLVGIFPFMVKFLGIHGSFYCFAGFAVMNTLCGFVIVPETKGLTNEQIQDLLLRKRR